MYLCTDANKYDKIFMSQDVHGTLQESALLTCKFSVVYFLPLNEARRPLATEGDNLYVYIYRMYMYINFFLPQKINYFTLHFFASILWPFFL